VVRHDLETEGLSDLPALLEIRREPGYDVWASEIKRLEVAEAATVHGYRVGDLDLVTVRVKVNYERVLRRRWLDDPTEPAVRSHRCFGASCRCSCDYRAGRYRPPPS
jgi:hypothetical protein